MIFRVCEHFEKNKRDKANLDSRVHALGWTDLFNGFAGDSGKRSDPVDMLPFPDEVKKSKEQDRELISDATLTVLKELVDREKLPPGVIGAIMGVSEKFQRYLAEVS